MANTDFQPDNIKVWLRGVTTDADALDADIVERMADGIMQAMMRVAGAGTLALPETLAALVRVHSILLGGGMMDETPQTIRKQCATLGRTIAGEALAFRDAARHDGIRMVARG